MQEQRVEDDVVAGQDDGRVAARLEVFEDARTDDLEAWRLRAA